MVKVCEKMCCKSSCRKKNGFGIVEVLISAVVLGFLYAALSNLQGGNHDALLRIRGRDGATEVAQEFIDNLRAKGVAKLTDDKLVEYPSGSGVYMLAKNGEGGLVPDTVSVERKWTGQPGLVEHTMTVNYKVVVAVSPDAQYVSNNSTLFSEKSAEASERVMSHVYAKRLDVTVSWKYKNSMQSITVSGVIR